jgi:flagellar assembly factor FliW
MRIDTTRFGTLSLNASELFLFPQGLIGMETLRHWALLPDPGNPAVAWLQSASRGDRAIGVISPRLFFPDYRVSVSRRELTCLRMRPDTEIYVLTAISGHVGRLSVNLRAPMLLNLNLRLGCQVITNDDQPLQRAMPSVPSFQQQLPESSGRQAA